jgi:hypothetical protein
METRECLECGFECEPGDACCPKCDASLHEQTDGSTVTVDIAHRYETIVQATDKFSRAIDRELGRRTRILRVITGQGAIRDAIRPALQSLKSAGRIVRFEQDGRNTGAFLVTLRKGN